MPQDEISYKGKTLGEWITRLIGKDVSAGVEAELALVEIGSEAIPDLRETLKSERSKIAWGAILRVLAKIAPRDSEAIQALIDCFSERLETSNKEIAETLAKVGKPALPYLIEALSSDIQHRRWNAERALGNMGEKAKEAVPRLIESVRVHNSSMAAWALGEIGDQRAIPTLSEALIKKDLPIEAVNERALKSFVATALGKIGHLDGLRALQETVNDENADVREKSREAIEEIIERARQATVKLRDGTDTNFTLEELLKREPIDLSRAMLQQVDLRNRNLEGANFAGADLRGANLSGSLVRGANFQGADLSTKTLHGKVHDSGYRILSTNLRGADLSKANFEFASMNRIDLRKATLVGAKLINADLDKASLGQANLQGAILRKARLTNATFSGAQLFGADLSGTDLKGSIFRGASSEEKQQGFIDEPAEYDRQTKWPEGFDPRAAKARLHENAKEEDAPQIKPLTLLIDPGTASSEEISDLLRKLSEAYRVYGGSGIHFVLKETREGVETGVLS